MTRVFGHYISVEMTLLWLVELFLSFILIYLVLVSAGVTDAAGAALQPTTLNLAAMLAITIGGMALMIGLYRPETCVERRRLLVNGMVAGLLAFPAVLAVSEVLQITLNHFYLLRIAKVLLAWFACLLVTRWAFGFAVRQKLFTRRVLIIGSGDRADRISNLLRKERGRFVEFAGAMTAGDAAAAAGQEGRRLVEALRRDKIWGIVVACESGADLPTDALVRCKLHGIRIFADLDFWERHMGRINLEQLNQNWLLFADGFSTNRFDDAARRLLDIAASLSLLLLTLPLMVIVALLIKLDSPGPVFYRQERVGLHGRRFTLLKFRSMQADAEAGGRPRWASRNDPRVTRVGALIRLTRIDELPQLINVLRGQMGFVGPRPERPHFVEQLARVIPFYDERSYVKPGITGWAQVNYPYGASVEDAREKLSYDLYYVKNRSLFLDLLILISTVRVILFQEGAR